MGRAVVTRRGGRLALVLVLALGLLGGWLPTAGVARAATLVVTSDADSGAGTLRQAIADAAPGDTITFDLPTPQPWTITLTTAGLTLDKGLTIQGPGADKLAVRRSAAAETPEFSVFSVTAAVTLSDLAIGGGRAANGGGLFITGGGATLTGVRVVDNVSAVRGGGIYMINGATLALSGTTFEANTAAVNGGGLYIRDSGTTLTMTGGAFLNNTAGGIGGGFHLANGPQATLTDVTVAGNAARFGGGGQVEGSAAAASGLTFSGNTATGTNTTGGGAMNVNYGATLTLANSTLSDNTSPAGVGGALSVREASATLVNTTIVENSAAVLGDQFYIADGTVTATNTILAGAAPSRNCALIGAGVLTNGGNNLDDGASCGFGEANGSHSVVEPFLGPLQDNGGPTATRLPGPSSPAIDAGSGAACANSPVGGLDQRGVARPQGGRCDIGAVEATVYPAPALTGLATTPAPPVAGAAGAITLTLDGNGFVGGASVVRVNGRDAINGGPIVVTEVSPTRLTATLPAFPSGGAGSYLITVTNPPLGGATSNPLALTVENPAPTLAAVSPSAAQAGAGDTTLTLTGGAFAPGATVQFGGTPLTPTSIAGDGASLAVTVPAALLADARTVAVTVTNPGPGGGPSAPAGFAITAAPPAPASASVAPASLTFGARQVGTVSDSQQVVLTNGGGSPLTVPDGGVTIGGSQPGDFAVTFTTCVGQVPAGGSCVVGIRFAPTATGDRAATLSIADSAAGSPRTVALTGTGTPPPPTPQPRSVVTASAQGQGGVTPAGSTSYATGGAATYAATPAAGQVFLGWTLDGQFVGYASPLTFTVEANRTLVATFAPRPSFGDVPATDPDYEAVTRLAALGIVNPQGVNGSGQFAPGRPVARAEVAAFIARLFGWDAEFHRNTFPDRCAPDGGGCVDDELWNAVAALADYGVVGGYTDPATCGSAGTTAPCYLPRDRVNRLQVVSVVARAFTRTPDLRPTGYWDRLPAVPGQYANVPDDGTQRSDLATYRANAGPIPGQAGDDQFPDPAGAATRRFIIQVLFGAYQAQFGTDRVP